jgi:hypothetical protein
MSRLSPHLAKCPSGSQQMMIVLLELGEYDRFMGSHRSQTWLWPG